MNKPASGMMWNGNPITRYWQNVVYILEQNESGQSRFIENKKKEIADQNLIYLGLCKTMKYSNKK